MLEAAAQPAARDRAGETHEIEARARPDILRRGAQARARLDPVEAGIRHAVDMRLQAGGETAAEPERAMEFPRASEHANARRVERGGHAVAGARLDPPAVPQKSHGLGRR